MGGLFLKYNKGFKWFFSEKVFIKGYFFDNKNNYYHNSNLISFFKNVFSEEDFISKIKEANGIFTVIIKLQNKIFVASDTTRFFTLFYSFKQGKLSISDDIKFLKESLQITEFDKQSEQEFLSSTHVHGNKTLLKDIFQVQSNEYIVFKNNKILKQNFFFSYSTNKINTVSYNKKKKEAFEVFENAFERLIISLKNRHIAIPLSGGYDSRLIAAVLKKNKYENVTCFTYGRKNNAELANAKKTAKSLNYKWIFIEYNNLIFNNFLKEDSFKDYAHFVGKYSSMPLLQEYFAVKYLKTKKLIPDDTIFIPGHSGDFIGGSQLVKVLKNNLRINEIPSLLYKKKFFYKKKNRLNANDTKKRIRKNLRNFDKNYFKKIPYSVAEDYDIKEKFAKFIFNSSSVYNYFGYENRFPFWDKELLMFFKDVPFEYKKMKLLYDDVLKNIYFEPMKLNFDKEIQATSSEIFIQKLKTKIKLVLPFFIKKRFLLKNDKLNYAVSTKQMLKSLIQNNLQYKHNIKSYNEIIIQWYIYFSKDFIK